MVVRFMPRPLYPAETPVPIGQKVGLVSEPACWMLFFIPLLAPTGAWGIHETFRFTSVS
jgi:hypothetical protein